MRSSCSAWARTSRSTARTTSRIAVTSAAVCGPIVAARAQALTHAPSTGGAGASVFGIPEKVSPEWAAWANGVAVRELFGIAFSDLQELVEVPLTDRTDT